MTVKRSYQLQNQFTQNQNFIRILVSVLNVQWELLTVYETVKNSVIVPLYDLQKQTKPPVRRLAIFILLFLPPVGYITISDKTIYGTYIRRAGVSIFPDKVSQYKENRRRFFFKGG